jgi:hypothetical protein
MRLVWKGMDLVDFALDHLSKDRRWEIVDFLMRHDLMDICRVSGYLWSQNIGEDSLFDLSSCHHCSTDPYCYCGKERSA